MPSRKPAGFDAVASGLQKLQQGAMPTDFILKSDSGRTWNVHKTVLLMHSDVLFRMATSPNFIESQQGFMTFIDTDDRCIDTLVDYMYDLKINLRGCYPSYGTIVSTTATKSEASYLFGLYQLAHMYNVGPVVDEVLGELMCWFTRTGTTIDLIELLLDAGAEYDTVPPELQACLADEMAAFLEWKAHLDMDKVHVVMKKHPEFSVDVLQATLKNQIQARW